MTQLVKSKSVVQISKDLGTKPANFTLDMLAAASRCRIEKETTTFIDGVGKSADIAGDTMPPYHTPATTPASTR